MTRSSKLFSVGARLVVLTILLAGLVPRLRAQSTPQSNDVFTPLNAAAVLPLPEAMRAGATIVERGLNGEYKVVRKGSNGTVCSAGKSTENFHASCYHELIFAADMRRVALAGELGKAGKPADAKAVGAALADEVKAGKVKLPDHPTTGFRMYGPASGYNAGANTVSSEIKSWQMIIIPFATGASLSLPEKDTSGMPWVMNSGTWIAHVMVEH